MTLRYEKVGQIAQFRKPLALVRFQVGQFEEV